MVSLEHPDRFVRAVEAATVTGSVDRRRVLQLAAAIGLTTASHLTLGGSQHAAARQPGTQDIPSSSHLWLLDSPDALRPDAPGEPTAEEIAELLDFQQRRSDETMALASTWGHRQAVLPWNELTTELVSERFGPGLLELRCYCLVRTAMHDAVVAALDAQQAFSRAAPAATDERIEPVGDAGGVASFPSVHAAVAGAASTVLAYLFPDASDDGFAGVAEEAATSRLWAGAAFRSDIEAGLSIGRSVGELAIAWGQADGSDAAWDGSEWPTGEGLYERTPPNFADPIAPLAGTWATWVLPSGDACRPAPFPEAGSPGFNAELDTVRRATQRRTAAEERIIDFWLSKGPNGYFSGYAQDMIERENLGDAEAANILAMMSVAMYDSLVAVWDAKYHYWVARPLTMDPDLNLYIPNPPYPSYPGGFGAASGAGATVLADCFPGEAVALLSAAVEAAAQRGWAGIHYVLDDDVALLMGGQVGRMTVSMVRGAN